MRRHGMAPARGNEVNVTPLIDVVMCLIIFFMLATKIGINNGADKAIKLPESVMGVNLKDLGGTVLLNVRPPMGANTSAMGSELPVVTLLKGDEIVEMPLMKDLGSAKQFPLVEFLKAVRERNHDYKVIIRADATMQFRFLAPVLVACREGGAKAINFTTKTVTHMSGPNP